MNANDLIHSINARALLFGAAIAMAVAAAATISVTADETAFASKNIGANVEVVRLEPVAVTISPERFDAIRAESQSPSVIARARGANKAAPRV